MTKTLLLVRHAQAEDQSKMFKDFDRELTSRGIMDAARLGHELKKKDFTVDQLKTSAAARTQQTTKVIAEQLKIDVDTIEAVDDLYGGGPQAYLAALNTTPDTTQTLLLCGHNPDISYFAEYLTHADVASLEKCTLLVINFGELGWAEISAKTGSIAQRISRESLKSNT